MSDAPDNRRIQQVSIFAGSRIGNNPAWESWVSASEELGTLLGQNGYDLAYGGGDVGYMAAVVKTALAEGSRVKGFIDRFWHEATGSNSPPGVDEVVVESREQRKLDMRRETQASILLPGAIGSMDELFDIYAWQDEQRYRVPSGTPKRPIIVLNTNGAHDPLKNMIERWIADGQVYGESVNLIRFVDTPEEVIEILNEYNKPQPVKAPEFRPNPLS